MSKLFSFTSVLLCHFRYTRRHVRPYLRDLYNRRLAQGPEIYRPRSEWTPWDRKAELSAFLHRINEAIDLPTLDQVLTDRSYTLLLQPENENMKMVKAFDNQALSQKGLEISRHYIMGFLRSAYPRIPEEWICSITDHLLSKEELAFAGALLGLKDLVVYSDRNESKTDRLVSGPPSLKVIANAFSALIGAISNQIDKSHLFIRDFLLSRLVDLDLTGDIIPIENPLPLLCGVLAFQKRGPPEPRLQYQSGMNTLLSCYQVGIYSDSELISEAPGETIQIAEEEAARQALRNLLGLFDHRAPLNLHGPLQPIDPTWFTRPNPSIETYLAQASEHCMIEKELPHHTH